MKMEFIKTTRNKMSYLHNQCRDTTLWCVGCLISKHGNTTTIYKSVTQGLELCNA